MPVCRSSRLWAAGTALALVLQALPVNVWAQAAPGGGDGAAVAVVEKPFDWWNLTGMDIGKIMGGMNFQQFMQVAQIAQQVMGMVKQGSSSQQSQGDVNSALSMANSYNQQQTQYADQVTDLQKKNADLENQLALSGSYYDTVGGSTAPQLEVVLTNSTSNSGAVADDEVYSSAPTGTRGGGSTSAYAASAAKYANGGGMSIGGGADYNSIGDSGEGVSTAASSGFSGSQPVMGASMALGDQGRGNGAAAGTLSLQTGGVSIGAFGAGTEHEFNEQEFAAYMRKDGKMDASDVGAMKGIREAYSRYERGVSDARKGMQPASEDPVYRQGYDAAMEAAKTATKG